jgi:hypothetical protein
MGLRLGVPVKIARLPILLGICRKHPEELGGEANVGDNLLFEKGEI